MKDTVSESKEGGGVKKILGSIETDVLHLLYKAIE